MTQIEELERKIVLKRQVIAEYQKEQVQLERKIRNTRLDIQYLRMQINEIREKNRRANRALYEMREAIDAKTKSAASAN